MDLIAEIQQKIAEGQFEFSRHATDRMILRQITIQEIREAIDTAAIIEDYPDDKYGPSCLLLGLTVNGRPLHVQCSYPTRALIKIITVYEPEPSEWIEFRVRR